MGRKSARHFATNNERAENSTTALFVRNHASPQHLLEQVENLFERGQIHEARHVIECIIENNNALITTPKVFTLHSKIFIEIFGFNVHAQCSIQQALLIDSNDEEALELQCLADIHEELRDGLYEVAETRLRKFLGKNPRHPYALYLLANHLFWKNGPEAEALELLESCVKVRPSFLKAWLCLAMAYKKSQNLTKAEDAFQECLDLDTNSTNKEFYKKHLQSI